LVASASGDEIDLGNFAFSSSATSFLHRGGKSHQRDRLSIINGG